jgi:hypothetical protein
MAPLNTEKDMSNMSDRELLVLLGQKTEHIEKRVDDIAQRINLMTENNVNMALKMREVETKLKFYAAGISVIVAITTSIATSLIINLIQ